MRQRGERLGGRYRLDEPVGAGGMGEVWRATDEVLGRVVAVKVILPRLLSEYGFAQRFLAEARAMASVHHPGVVAIHDYQSDGEVAFLVMDYVPGESLAQVLRRHGRLTPEYAMSLVAQAAEALQAVHSEGIVHRDIKPGNLLIRADGPVVLTDFGIARAPTGTGLTLTGAVIGTPTYLAPEQVLGQPATPLSDVYSLGLVAYECLAGRGPFAGDSPVAAALQRIREAPPPLPDHLPPGVRSVVERALAADPAHRWRSAGELAQAARWAFAGHRGTAPPAAVPAPSRPHPAVPHRPTHRRRWALLAGALLGVVLLGTGSWLAVTIDRGGGEPGRGQGGVPSPTGDPRLAGYPACGEFHCPPEPMCWGGLTVIGGVAQPVRQLDCAEPHYWETFAVVPLPDDARDDFQEDLINRDDIGAVCSDQVMVERSADPSATEGWGRDAWPFEVDGGWILHCIATSTGGETTGSVFRGG